MSQIFMLVMHQLCLWWLCVANPSVLHWFHRMCTQSSTGEYRHTVRSHALHEYLWAANALYCRKYHPKTSLSCLWVRMQLEGPDAFVCFPHNANIIALQSHTYNMTQSPEKLSGEEQHQAPSPHRFCLYGHSELMQEKEAVSIFFVYAQGLVPKNCRCQKQCFAS